MTASAVFILDTKGKVIISRNYRGDVPMNCVERFSGHVLEADEADERPVWLEHGTTYVYIKYNNLYIMAVTQRNSNAAMILLFLYRLVEVRACTSFSRGEGFFFVAVSAAILARQWFALRAPCAALRTHAHARSDTLPAARRLSRFHLLASNKCKLTKQHTTATAFPAACRTRRSSRTTSASWRRRASATTLSSPTSSWTR